MKRIKLFLFSLFSLLCSLAGVAHTENPSPAKVPHWATFQRTLEVEAFGQAQPAGEVVNQSLRMRLRYLDPAVNAYAAVVANFHHFNEDLRLDEPPTLDEAEWLGNVGLGVGLVRGRHLWGIDLMAVYAGTTLGPAVTLIGEHQMTRRFSFYHTTQLNLFTGDTEDAMLDADQGLGWTAGDWTLRIGYRVVSGMHMNKNGPRAGLLWRFNSRKIPFIFPSLG